MIQNNYKQRSYGQSKEIVSPLQMRNRPYDIKDNRVVQEEIEKNLRSYQLTVTMERDVQTLQAFNNIPGVIAFICTLKKDGQILGFGRGMAVVNRLNKYLDRTINFAANAALIDSVVRATKMLDVLHIDFTKQNTAVKTPGAPVEVEQESYYEPRESEFVPITPRQRGYLVKLLENIGADDSEISSVDEMSKSDAAGRISELAGK